MTQSFTRDELLRRALGGSALLTVPGLLAACGGSKKAATTTAAAAVQQLPKTITFSNWPLYIDLNQKTKTHPTLVAFEKHYGVHVNYIEDINDNPSFFGKIEGPLSQGQPIGRDLIVMTDSSGLPGRMIELGWLEKLDKSAIPNIKNLQPTQQHPSWDPNREYSLPWQSGMTGIGYDPKLVNGDIRSLSDLLTNPKLKGKVTMLLEMSDSIGITMLANGDDPAKTTDATFTKAINTLQKAVSSGQIRQFTGNDYAPLLAKGDIYACLAWSGDMVQLQADHPGLKWVLPDTGGMIWTDNMLIPKGGNAFAASTLMNWYYRPDIAAKVEDYVNYICPVVGAAAVLEKTDPAVAKNPLIFPTQKMLANTHFMDTKALLNPKYQKQFQKLTGG
ncbi:MAG TPA: spermidine/putrescine ABC transporter substrate-binding protein [Gaiellaceae bacterium]|nr:spermidine/putrescine ABC transporter substrate-binding protein [Gaiellaceae bacterium]